MPIKTLIINGSPRKNGGTAKITQKLISLLHGETEIIHTYSSNISPCIDCRFCWKNDSCAIKDDMQRVYNIIAAADNIVIASPIYFAELTGSVLNWASRLQYFWTAKNFRKVDVLGDKVRRGGIILVDGGDGYSEVAYNTARRLLRIMNAEVKGFVYFSGTDKHGPVLPELSGKLLDDINKLAQVLNND